MRTTIDKAGRVVIPAQIRSAGGRIYDSHIAEVARAGVIVTDNRRHFLTALRYDMRVQTPTEFLDAMKKRG